MDTQGNATTELGATWWTIKPDATAYMPIGWHGVKVTGVGVVACLVALMLGVSEMTLLLVLVGGALAAVGALALWQWLGGQEVFFHERGVRRRQFDRDQIMRYDDIEELTFESMRYFVNGVYSGTFFNLKLRSAEPGSRPIRLACRHQEQSGLVSGYRHQHPIEQAYLAIASQLAGRWQSRLDLGESVPWTGKCSLTKDGLQLPRRGHDPETIPWEEIDHVHADEGSFQLWVRGNSRPRLKLATSAANFYPGYLLVCDRLQSLPPVARPAPSAPATDGPELKLQFVWNTDDHFASQRCWYETTAAGRWEWWRRVLVWPALAVALALFIIFMTWSRNQLSDTGLALAIVAAAGVAVPLASWFYKLNDRWQLGKELQAAFQLSKRGEAHNPFAACAIALAPWGYRYEHADQSVTWEEIGRVVWYKGYCFTYLAATRLSDEQVDLMIPPRAFPSADQAAEVFRTLKEWHAARH